MSGCRSSQSFSLVELLAVIAIMAILISGAIYFTASYIQWAKQTTEKEIYTVLNDELTRYKSGGGNLSALTVGAPMNDIFTALKTPVVPAGMPASFSQQFMATGYTYPGRSIFATGNGQQYHFYQVDQYVGQNLAPGTPTDQYPYGQGVAYLANGAGMTSNVFIGTSTGYFAVSGHSTSYSSSSPYSIPAATSITVWACSSSSTTQSGTITYITVGGSNVTAIDVSGLGSSLYSLSCTGNPVASLNVSGCSGLQTLYCGNSSLTTLNVSSCSGLKTLLCEGSPLLTSITVPSPISLALTMDISSTGILATRSAADAFYGGLPTVSLACNIEEDDSGTDNLWDANIATAKGWNVTDVYNN
jgi:type II secretory pathway pseudopilin PulG